MNVGLEGDRPLPQNLDAERSVLGAILIHNPGFTVVAELVQSRDFFRDAHRRIFEKMDQLHCRGDAIDFITLKEVLSRSGELDEVGGPVYLSALVDGLPHVTNIEYYARIVRECSRRRRLIFSANMILANAFEGEEETALLVERAHRAFNDIDAGQPVNHLPPFDTLRQRLAQPRPALSFRIGNWMPTGSRVLLAAQYKAGKTSLLCNALRPLLDGGLFLGRDAVTPVDGTVALLDFEMGERQLLDWLDAQQIRNDDRLVVIPMRGRASDFNILNPHIRMLWAQQFRANQVVFIGLDCLRPILDAIGLDEHREAGRFLVAFDALLAEAEIPEALIVHHMGHTGERSRGDSRLRDWPDVEWRLVRRDENPASARFLMAYGRDVDVPECQLTFDPCVRRVVIAGGSRRDAKAIAALVDVIAVLRDRPRLSGRQIKDALADQQKHRRDTIDNALKIGTDTGQLFVTEGPKGSHLYTVGPPGFPASSKCVRVSGPL